MTASAPPIAPDERDAAASATQTVAPAEIDRPSGAGTVWASGIAMAGAAVVLGSLFDGLAGPLLAALSALGGAGLVAWSIGGRRGAVVQWAAAPVALAIGALAALLGGGTSGIDLPSLVADALFSGGLAQPPVPLDPGWRFLLASSAFLLGFGGASVGQAWARPKLGVALAIPVVVLGVVAQPADAGPVAVTLGLLGLVGGLVIAYAVEVASLDPGATRQPRQMARAVGAMAVLGIALVALAQLADGLLPDPSEARVIPPQRPPVSAPGEDVELFTVQTDRALPWRLGVLDVYEDDAWKTPPYDVSRFEAAPPVGADEGQPLLSFTFIAQGLGGRTLPGVATPASVVSAAGEVLIDPRTDALRFERLLTPEVRWTVLASAPPTTEALAAAPRPGSELEAFLDAPPPPPEVAALLAATAGPAGSHAALQAVRQSWYEVVVAAGVGDPVDVTAERVAAILRGDGGSEATPWEIVAGEALLARWAGVPARLGYGWFGGDEVNPGVRSVRPAHGAVWLEAHFEGIGWVPLVGKPPRAKASLSDAPKNEDAAVRPTDELALITYVPIRRQGQTLLFEVVRYWTVRIVPSGLALVVAGAFLPMVRRSLRRHRWSRWSRRQGPAAEVLVEYAALRDRAWDLNIGRPAQTPLEFADAVRPDAEHRELAWLVTRVLWGDLSGAVGDQHVEAVRRMATSVTQRLVRAQPGAARVVAAASRASLTTPYALEAHQATRRHWPRLRGRRRSGAAMAAVLALLLGACGETVDLTPGARADVLPATLVPRTVDGVRFQPEPDAEVAFTEAGDDALVDFGHVWSIRVEDTIEASLQIVALRPGAAGRSEDVRDGLLASLGGGRFEPVRVGEDSALAVETTEQRLLLWFSPGGDWYQLLVARRSFDRADEVFAAVLAAQRGQRITGLDDLGGLEPIDPKRGTP